ncbi:MAG: hypothetical protein V2I56_21080 [Desulfobacteraceae bacterium]|jgi:hypothetical protein|nr:hypothetical protein [Desulfobacteraceae bacterium]
MARYQHKDVESILKLFELELSTLNRLSRLDKMKIRKRVANAILPALAASNSEPDLFLNMVENKLRDVFDLFFDGWGFREKLHKRVGVIVEENKKRQNEQQAAGEPG